MKSKTGNEISVTEAINPCGRRWQHDFEITSGILEFGIHTTINGITTVKLPDPHVYSSRGILTHSALDRYVKGDFPEWTYEDFLSYDKTCKEQSLDGISEKIYNFVLPYSKKCYGRGVDFLESTNIINLENAVTENRLIFDIGGMKILSGKPDLSTDDVLLDWKTGKESFLTRTKYEMQLSAYAFLLNVVDGVEVTKRIIVYLGGANAQISGINNEMYEDSIDKFLNLLEISFANKEKAYNGEEMPCKITFLCTMCEYAGMCRGV